VIENLILVIVGVRGMHRKPVYFDHNATTPLLEGLKDAMLSIADKPLNSSSVHVFGREAKHILESARLKVAHFANADDSFNVIFVASGTEGNNLALKGLKDLKLITSTTEHLSVLSVAKFGDVPVNSDGIVDLKALEMILSEYQPNQCLVSIQYVNNETGVIQPIKELSEIVHKYHGIMHTDATQAFGKIDVDVVDLDVDMITMSAHKFGGPIGAAALILKKGIELTPLMHGGGQEYRIRPGTPNVMSIHGFGLACDIAKQSLPKFAEIAKLRDFIEDALLQISPDSIVFGDGARRVANTTSITMPNVQNETQVIYFDLNGFAVSAGSACSSGKVSLPYVQMSMGYDEEVSRTAVRISLGVNNTKAQVEEFINLWKELFLSSNKNQQLKVAQNG
jgi:cysteine desulfurase